MSNIPAVLSIVIPTLDEADCLEGTLKAVAEGSVNKEVIVADGGSSDATRDIGERLGARIVEAPRGRGSQLAAGAATARGGWLLFVHADTVLAKGWAEAAAYFIAEPGNVRQAAVFRLGLDDANPAARFLERLVCWRTRVLGLPYGDQGLLISRVFYDELGGFRDMELMEDVDMIRRIGRRRFAELDAVAVTSAQRYREEGYVLRPLRNLLCLVLYFLGVPPARIAGIYARNP